MSTRKEYLEDPLKNFGTAQIVKTGSDENGQYVVLDSTIFYPQGGGQPSDLGIIHHEGQQYPIHFVHTRGEEIFHYSQSNLVTELREGLTVELQIDADKRKFHSRNHTAGHLLCFVAETLFPNLVGEKGHHFPEGAYVEFSGRLESMNLEEAKERIEKTMAETIHSDLQVYFRLLRSRELGAKSRVICEKLDSEELVRVMCTGDFMLPCGGTHVNRLGEVGQVSIRKIKLKGDKTKISYQIAEGL